MKLQRRLQALQNRLDRYISKSVKATRQMILDLIFAISRLERMIEVLTPAFSFACEIPHEEGEDYGEDVGFFEEYALLSSSEETKKFFNEAQKIIDNPVAKLIKAIESERMSVKRWTNYGKDRLYITMPNGVQMGFVDLIAKKLVVTYSKCGKFDGIVEYLIETIL